MTEVPLSQAYQLIIGRVVALEDRQELMEDKLQDIEEMFQGLEKTFSNNLDELWDTVVAALESFDRQIPPREKRRVSYPSDGLWDSQCCDKCHEVQCDDDCDNIKLRRNNW